VKVQRHRSQSLFIFPANVCHPSPSPTLLLRYQIFLRQLVWRTRSPWIPRSFLLGTFVGLHNVDCSIHHSSLSENMWPARRPSGQLCVKRLEPARYKGFEMHSLCCVNHFSHLFHIQYRTYHAKALCIPCSPIYTTTHQLFDFEHQNCFLRKPQTTRSSQPCRAGFRIRTIIWIPSAYVIASSVWLAVAFFLSNLHNSEGRLHTNISTAV
jgi:hypothetical protein